MDGNGEHPVHPDRRWSRNYTLLPNRAQDAGALGTGSEGGRQPERLQQLRRLTAAIWRRGCVTAADAFPQPCCADDSNFQTELGTARCHTNERLGLGRERGFDRRVRRIQVEKKLRQEYEWHKSTFAAFRLRRSPKMIMQNSRSVLLGGDFTMSLGRTLQRDR